MLGVKITLAIAAFRRGGTGRERGCSLKEPPGRNLRGQDRRPALGGKPADFVFCRKLWRHSAGAVVLTASCSEGGQRQTDRRRRQFPLKACGGQSKDFVSRPAKHSASWGRRTAA